MKKVLLSIGSYGMLLPLMAEPDAPPVKQVSSSFVSVIVENGWIGIGVWSMLFLTSMVTLWLIIDAMISVKHEKLCPPKSLAIIKNGIEVGNLTPAMDLCNECPSFFTAVIKAGFEKIPKGWASVKDAAGGAMEAEEEKLMQRLNYLGLCGTIAPMFGLLGTVTGMSKAFFALGTATGAEKAQLLALAISQALYATAGGLIIAIPALVFCIILKNKATRSIIQIDRDVSDIIKELEGRV